MGRKKISNLELDQLIREGNGVSEIARKLGVSKGAVSKRLKALNVAITKDVTLHHAGEIVEKKLDAIGQLQKINDYANELLDLLMRWNRGDNEALQILESQVRKVKIRGQEEEVTEYRFKDPRELALKAMAEIRGQLNLQLEIFRSLYDMAAVAEFQKEVLTAIGEVSPDVRDKIIHNLQKARAIRSTLEFNQRSV
jgi:AcrR family transcriptional regulator